MLPGSVSYICLFSFQSILGRFFWNFITGPSIFPLPLLAPRQRNFDRSLQIPRQPSQLEGTKYPKLNSWICRPNSHVALFTIRSELRTPTYTVHTTCNRECGASPLYLQACMCGKLSWLRPIVFGSPLSLIYGDIAYIASPKLYAI